MFDRLIIAGAVLIPFSQIRRGSWLSKGSIVGAIGTILIMIGIPVAAIIGMTDNSDPVKTDLGPEKVMDIFTKFNTMLFMFGPSALYPTIKAGMKERKRFNSANMVAHVLSLFVYLLAGLMAYAAFGESVNENVIYSMGSHIKRTIPGVADLQKWDEYKLERWWVGWPVAIAMFCCCLVAAPVRIIAFFGGFIKNYPFWDKNIIINTCFRIFIVLLILFLTILVPNLDTLMGLVTALVSPMLKFSLAAVYYKAAKETKGEQFPMWMWGVAAFGIVLAGFGFVLSIINIINIEHHDQGSVFGDFFGTARNMRVLLSDSQIEKEHKP